ncbi:heme NO-binding domain-containing protein [candidate division WOR-3 bacterium]|nr:heme NO-binding domain-containing protein [candidate division WOR-3 bacterium]
MKGVITIALREMIMEKYGKEKWEAILKKADLDTSFIMLPISNIDDEIVLKIVNSVCEILNISLVQAADAFGEYWVAVYAQKLYHSFFINVKTAKEFLLKMDSVHVTTTKNMPDAHPPRFEYEWKDDKTLIMKYKSERNLIDIFVGLIKGVGKYYKEDLKVTKLEDNKVEIIFP